MKRVKADITIGIQITILIVLFIVYFVFPQHAFKSQSEMIPQTEVTVDAQPQDEPDAYQETEQAVTIQSTKDTNNAAALRQPPREIGSPALTPHSPPPVDYSKQKVHYKNKAVVLCYHHFDDNENGITIASQRFHNHLEMLAKNDYNIITMEQFVQFIKNNDPVPQNAILITFDDGYKSVYTKAFPELQKFRMIASTFLVGDSIDHPPPNGSPRLSWNEIREMRTAGNEFFSHTYQMHEHGKADTALKLKPVLAHPLYLDDEQRMETQDEYKARVKADLLKMEDRLSEELGPVRHLLAFPYGAYSETALEVGRGAGFELFFTTKEGINVPGKDEINRINAGAHWMSPDLLLKKLRKYDEK